VVGNGHLRLLVSGEDGGRLKAVAFRTAETPLGQALQGAGSRRLWLAGRMKRTTGTVATPPSCTWTTRPSQTERRPPPA
jgi:hypothetical protein